MSAAEAHALHEDERARAAAAAKHLAEFAEHERTVRERERWMCVLALSPFVDPGWDDTGFCPGGRL